MHHALKYIAILVSQSFYAIYVSLYLYTYLTVYISVFSIYASTPHISRVTMKDTNHDLSISRSGCMMYCLAPLPDNISQGYTSLSPHHVTRGWICKYICTDNSCTLKTRWYWLSWCSQTIFLMHGYSLCIHDLVSPRLDGLNMCRQDVNFEDTLILIVLMLPHNIAQGCTILSAHHLLPWRHAGLNMCWQDVYFEDTVLLSLAAPRQYFSSTYGIRWS